MKNTQRLKICGPDSVKAESRRAFLKNSIRLGLLGFTYSLASPIALANSMLSSSSRTNLLKDNVISYKGYLYDSTIRAYRLGARHYSPFTKTFNTPDSFSPLGVAGPNRYQYADGNPINNRDPSGHYSGWLIGLIAAVTAFTTVLTFGLAGIAFIGALTTTAVVVGSLLLVSGVTGLASGALSISSIILQEDKPELAKRLGDAAFGLGIVSVITGSVGFAVGSGAGSFGQFFSVASRVGRNGGAVANTLAKAVSKAAVTNLGEGYVAMSQAIITSFSRNSLLYTKIAGVYVLSSSGITSIPKIRQHINSTAIKTSYSSNPERYGP